MGHASAIADHAAAQQKYACADICCVIGGDIAATCFSNVARGITNAGAAFLFCALFQGGVFCRSVEYLALFFEKMQDAYFSLFLSVCKKNTQTLLTVILASQA